MTTVAAAARRCRREALPAATFACLQAASACVLIAPWSPSVCSTALAVRVPVRAERDARGEHAPNGGMCCGPRRPSPHRGDAWTFPRLRRRAHAGGQLDVGECDGGRQALAVPHCRAVRATDRSLRRRRRQRRRADSARLPQRAQAVPLPRRLKVRCCGRLSSRPGRVVNCDPSAAGRVIRAADDAALRRSCIEAPFGKAQDGPHHIRVFLPLACACRQDVDARCALGKQRAALGDAWTQGDLNELCRRAPLRVGRACVVLLASMVEG